MTANTSTTTIRGLKSNVLGFPRIGTARELKRAVEAYWNGSSDAATLEAVAHALRRDNLRRMKHEGIDLIPSNDFSLYDHVLDMTVMLGAVPQRYAALADKPLEQYFAMARGCQHDGSDVTAMEMTKWFDTNYHYIVPEFRRNQQFRLADNKALREFREAQADGILTKPVILGPVTFLLLGKEKEQGFSRIELLDNLLPAYCQLLRTLEDAGAQWIQIDEPMLAMDIDDNTKAAYRKAFAAVQQSTRAHLMLTTYFDSLRDNAPLAASLPVDAIHIDLSARPETLDELLSLLKDNVSLSLGLVDGRNIWKNDYDASLALIRKAIDRIGAERVMVATSSSLLHVPCDLAVEYETPTVPREVLPWLSFAWQKVAEVATLKAIASGDTSKSEQLAMNRADIQSRRTSTLVHDAAVAERVVRAAEGNVGRKSPYAVRAAAQQKALGLPLLPTTTIGSFPQTKEVRSWRSKHKNGEITTEQYKQLLRGEIERCIRIQEEIGLDVLVHGEFERNDMVEYFGEQLRGFAFTRNGWVQSYGSRCVKPPVIYGDVSRPEPMTVEWSTYAQSLTPRPMKGMLTGPVTIEKWSFVRNDIPRSETCLQIALAIADEVKDLEQAGIRIIQIDEPAIREALPLRKADRPEYLAWAVRCFRVSSSNVADTTQIHTHMCYSEFNDIIESIAAMDADAITIECSRSQMELLDAFSTFRYPNGIGPGVYDIHSPRVPDKQEITGLLHKAAERIAIEQLWVNPDCGLKTRGWDETIASLRVMVAAAKDIRSEQAK